MNNMDYNFLRNLWFIDEVYFSWGKFTGVIERVENVWHPSAGFCPLVIYLLICVCLCCRHLCANFKFTINFWKQCMLLICVVNVVQYWYSDFVFRIFWLVVIWFDDYTIMQGFFYEIFWTFQQIFPTSTLTSCFDSVQL